MASTADSCFAASAATRPADGGHRRATEIRQYELLCRLLAGRDEEQPADWDANGLVRAAFEHQVHHLLLAELRRRGSLAGCPKAVRDAFVAAERQAVLIEKVRAIELGRVLQALTDKGVASLIFKGTSVANTHYERPHLRPRHDVDLFIRRADVAAGHRTLQSLGFVRTNLITGEWVMPQFEYRRRYPAGLEHVFDVHWRLSNPIVFRTLLSFEDLWKSAVAIPALGEHARGPSDVHALFIACVHRVAHHNDSPRLIWLYDIHLIASGLSTAEWKEFEALAARTATRAVCQRGLALAAGRFGTPLPQSFVEGLGEPSGEPSAAFLGGRTGELKIQLSNWRALKTWSQRKQLLAEHLFPAASYVMAKYRVNRRAWLPALYLHRIGRGGLRWLRRPQA